MLRDPQSTKHKDFVLLPKIQGITLRALAKGFHRFITKLRALASTALACGHRGLLKKSRPVYTKHLLCAFGDPKSQKSEK